MELDELTQGMDIQWVSHTSHAWPDLAVREWCLEGAW